MIYDTSIPAEVMTFAQEKGYEKIRAVITTRTDSRMAIKTYEYLAATTASGSEIWKEIEGFTDKVEGELI